MLTDCSQMVLQRVQGEHATEPEREVVTYRVKRGVSVWVAFLIAVNIDDECTLLY